MAKKGNHNPYPSAGKRNHAGEMACERYQMLNLTEKQNSGSHYIQRSVTSCNYGSHRPFCFLPNCPLYPSFNLLPCIQEAQSLSPLQVLPPSSRPINHSACLKSPSISSKPLPIKYSQILTPSIPQCSLSHLDCCKSLGLVPNQGDLPNRYQANPYTVARKILCNSNLCCVSTPHPCPQRP